MDIDLNKYAGRQIVHNPALAGATFQFTGPGQKMIGTFSGHYWVAVEKKINQEVGDVVMVAKTGAGHPEDMQFIVNLRHWTTTEPLKIDLPDGKTFMIKDGKRQQPTT